MPCEAQERVGIAAVVVSSVGGDTKPLKGDAKLLPLQIEATLKSGGPRLLLDRLLHCSTSKHLG
jgi:hypothetical protein